MNIKKSSISLQRLLVTWITALIVISGLSIAGISYLGSRSMGYSLATQIMDDNANQVLNNVMDYLEDASKVNETIAYLIQSGEIDINTETPQDTLFQHYRHFLEMYPEFVGLYYGNEEGRFLFGKRMPDGTVSFRIIHQQDQEIHSQWIHEDSHWYDNGFPNSQLDLDSGYDPRNREWYRKAQVVGQNCWSDVYTFSSDLRPGITNAQPIFDEDHYLNAVIGIDISIIDISYFLNSLEISQLGTLLILNKDKEVIAISQEGSQLESSLSQITAIEEFPSELIRSSYEHVENMDIQEGLSSFSAEDSRYVASYLSFPPSSNVDWTVGIILPEEVILGGVHRIVRIILIVSILLILLSTLISLYLARRVITPLKLIMQDMARVRNFDLEGDYKVKTGLKELQEIDQSFLNMKNGMRSFRKYVPSKLVARLMTMGREAVLGGERRKLTVFFSDIAGFTNISEEMEPEALVEELADYLGNLSSTIQQNKGTVDKYIGDAIMAFWNAPEQVENHEALACETALQIQYYLKRFNEENPHRTHFPTRIGLNTGDVLVGNIGSEDRMNYTVMGDNINLGSRLESLNKFYGTSILVSQQTKVEAGSKFLFRPLDKVTVKGKSKPIIIYELVDFKKNVTKEQEAFVKSYEAAMVHYFNQNWAKSKAFLLRCLSDKPDDLASKKLMERIEEFQKNPPKKDWDGVFIHLNK